LSARPFSDIVEGLCPGTDAMSIISITGITKKFKSFTAVDNVSFDIAEGECFGLLGPNGAGKTTLIRMITCVSPADAGDITVAGLNVRDNPREIKARIGVVPQVDNLDEDLNTVQNLLTFARYFDIPAGVARVRAAEILRDMRLEEKRTARIDELSGGMKRRLLIGRGIINNPQILILDEPSIGLDPQAKHMVWQRLKELKSRGVTQLLCTQNMDEAAFLCERVAVMHQGRIIVIDRPRALVSRYLGERIWEVEVDGRNREAVLNALVERELEYEEAHDMVYVYNFEDGAVADLGGTIRPATLEDVFFKLTGRSLVE
jgi:lipooligosaccharide transport system ATP-binding protein